MFKAFKSWTLVKYLAYLCIFSLILEPKPEHWVRVLKGHMDKTILMNYMYN